MPLVPPRETRTVNGITYRAGQEYPDVKIVEQDKATIETPAAEETTEDQGQDAGKKTSKKGKK